MKPCNETKSWSTRETDEKDVLHVSGEIRLGTNHIATAPRQTPSAPNHGMSLSHDLAGTFIGRTARPLFPPRPGDSYGVTY